MAIITGETIRYPIPHEPSQWVELKLLSGRQMDKAEQLADAKAIQSLGPVMQELQGIDLPEPKVKTPEQERAAWRDRYDPEFLIKTALAQWSYTDEVPDDPEEVLDGVTRDWLWEFIVEQNSRPPALSLGGEPSSS